MCAEGDLRAHFVYSRNRWTSRPSAVARAAAQFTVEPLAETHESPHNQTANAALAARVVLLMKRYLPYILVAAVALSAIGAGAALYRTKKQRLAAATAVNVHDPAGAKPGAKPAHSRGSIKAPITLEEFADFQCPPCAGISTLVKDLEKKNPDRLRIVFRHYPLRNHANAVPAALAAEAAGLQGKFWEMHDHLFKNQAAWSKAPDARALFTEYAGAINLDTKRFATDMNDEKLKARVTADQERATSMGVSRTPSIFINGQAIPAESFSSTGLQTAIDSAAQGNKEGTAK